MAVLTKPRDSGDVFIREDLSREYDSESVPSTNGGAVNIPIATGQPITATGTITTAAELTTAVAALPALSADITGYLLKYITIPPGDTVQLAVLARGVGIVVNEDRLPINDGAGAPYIAGELKSMLEGMDFVVRAESDVEEQTT